MPNISQLRLDFINCYENAERDLAIMFVTNINSYNKANICILIFGATFLKYLKSLLSYKHKNIIAQLSSKSP